MCRKHILFSFTSRHTHPSRRRWFPSCRASSTRRCRPYPCTPSVLSSHPVPRERPSRTPADGLHLYFLVRHTTLHGGHGTYQQLQSLVVRSARRLAEVLVSTEACQPQYRTYVVLGIVLGGWCPTGDDVTTQKKMDAPSGTPIFSSIWYETLLQDFHLLEQVVRSR